jgi:deoxyribodipyrimidine photolyase
MLLAKEHASGRTRKSCQICPTFGHHSSYMFAQPSSVLRALLLSCAPTSLYRNLQELRRQYAFLEQTLVARRGRAQQKLPEMQKTLDVVRVPGWAGPRVSLCTRCKLNKSPFLRKGRHLEELVPRG